MFKAKDSVKIIPQFHLSPYSDQYRRYLDESVSQASVIFRQQLAQ